MKTITSGFKNTVKMFGRELDSIITYDLDGETIELGSEELNSITPHYEGSLLKSVMKCLELDSNEDIPLETILNYQFGVKVNGEYEYINFGNYAVYSSEKQEDTGSYKIICYDKMLYSMKDYEDLNLTYPITIRDYIDEICTHLGLTFKNASDTFANYNREIPNELYLDSDGNSLGYTFRDVLDEIAQATGSTICVNEQDDELEVRYVTETNDTIDEYYLKDINVNFGEKYGPINSIVLSRAEGSDNVYIQDDESIAENGLCELKIQDNQIMNGLDRADYLEDLLAVLDGMEYYTNDFASTGITYYDLCDRYSIQIGNETYSCIMLNDEILITQGLEENIHTDLLETSETDYTKADKTDRRINQTYIMVDKQNGVIEELASKIIDVSATVSGIGQIQLENAHEGGLHKLSIKGAIQNLYPKNTENYGHPVYPSNTLVPKNGLTPSVNVPHPIGLLYPSSELYPRSTKLVIDETEYDLDIDYLNYMNNTVCDEFIYEEGKCKIIRRVGTDSEGNMYALDDEVEETRNGIDLFVNSSSTIKMKAFTNAILSSEYLTQNEYTDVFATQVQLESEINQTAGRIEAKVSSVVDDDGNVTAGSIILAINRDESEATINADKIDLDANDVINLLAGNTINLTSKNISISSDNFSVDTEGNLTANNGTFSGNITGSFIDNSDIQVKSDNENSKFIIKNETHADRYVELLPSTCRYYYGGLVALTYSCALPNTYIGLTDRNNTNNKTTVSAQFISITNGTTTTNITATAVTPGSLAESKKNFELLENALDIIKNTDIYKYNFKNEKETDKQHIGFVIGDKFRYSHDVAGTDEDGKEIGADLYAMVSVCFKAIQEQQETIETLQKEIKELKNEK